MAQKKKTKRKIARSREAHRKREARTYKSANQITARKLVKESGQ